MAHNRRPLKTGDKVNLTLLISFCFFFFFDRNGSVVEDYGHNYVILKY